MSVLTEAETIINGPRQADYGHPFENFSLIAMLWEPVLNVPITPEQVAMCMIQLKVSRLVNSPDHRDSVIDLAGYAGCLGKIQDVRQESSRIDAAIDATSQEISFATIGKPTLFIDIPAPIPAIAENAMADAEVE